MTVRILLFIPTLDRGGAEKQLALLASHLPRDQFDVHVGLLTRGGPLADTLHRADIPIHEISKRWKVDPSAWWRTRRLIRHLRPSIVHTWIFAANCYGRHAALHSGVRHIVAGERCVDRWKVWHELAIDRYLARRTDQMVANSQGVVDFYVEHGIAADKFMVIPNGVDLRNGGPSGDRKELLNSLRLPPESRLIAAVGRLWPQKRYKDLIWAAELLKVVRDDTHLLIIGDGPQYDLLHRFRSNLQIEDRVHFLGHRPDVAEILPHCECLWLGSEYEGQSNAVMEAMSLGLPVVATDIAGNRDLVVPGETGYLVPVGDRAAFARMTLPLLDDPALAEQLGTAARHRIGSRFSVEQMVSAYAKLYAELESR